MFIFDMAITSIILTVAHSMGFQDLRAPFWGVHIRPYNQDHSILGSVLGLPFSGKSTRKGVTVDSKNSSGCRLISAGCPAFICVGIKEQSYYNFLACTVESRQQRFI